MIYWIIQMKIIETLQIVQERLREAQTKKNIEDVKFCCANMVDLVGCVIEEALDLEELLKYLQRHYEEDH